MSDSSNDKPQFTNPLVKWVDYRLPIFTYMDHELNKYPTPRNLTYWWNYGSLAGVMLSVMIFSGIFLAMEYQPNADLAFGSIQHIMRDVNYGWLMRYIHMNGASMFFLLVYIHMFRGLYYGSYKSPRELLWLLGVVILLMMMAASFEGYVLPWGQMSYWGATVITNLFSAIPLVGQEIVTWLWGGFSVSQPTLNRFFALHYLIPFLILGVVVLHVVALHQHGSNNPLGIDMKGPQDRIPFHPYYTIKDAYGLALFFIFYAFFVFYAPTFFGEPDNSIPANPLVTPPEIVPEWYFLPYYAILRAFPTKLSGVIFFAASVMIFFVLPWLDGSPVRSGRYRPWFKKFFWVFVADCIGLGWIGGNSPTGAADIFGIGVPYLWIGRVLTFWYFFHFVVVLPLLGRFEPRVPLPTSISEEVLKERHGKGGGPLTPATVPMEKP